MSDKKEILVPDGKEDNNKNADHEGFVNYLYFVYFRQKYIVSKQERQEIFKTLILRWDLRQFLGSWCFSL